MGLDSLTQLCIALDLDQGSKSLICILQLMLILVINNFLKELVGLLEDLFILIQAASTA